MVGGCGGAGTPVLGPAEGSGACWGPCWSTGVPWCGVAVVGAVACPLGGPFPLSACCSRLRVLFVTGGASRAGVGGGCCRLGRWRAGAVDRAVAGPGWAGGSSVAVVVSGRSAVCPQDCVVGVVALGCGWVGTSATPVVVVLPLMVCAARFRFFRSLLLMRGLVRCFCLVRGVCRWPRR